MIRALFPQKVVFLPEEGELLSRLADEAGGHLRCRWRDPRLYLVEDLLEDLADLLEREPQVVTLNSHPSRWHRDAKAYSDALIAWHVRGIDEGGALEWAPRPGESEGGVYTPQDGDVARVDGFSFVHRITAWKARRANARRVSIVLV